MTPVFLLSLPRSGSTLIQRVLACHPQIATTSEPWLQLPAFYALREQGVSAEYDQKVLVEAMEDFCLTLPAGRTDYLQAVREMTLGLYRKAAKGAPFFLDKTPRYHLILDELLETFPDAKFIIIWRQPLAVAASMLETWGSGKWNLHLFDVDLTKGLMNMSAAYSKNQDRFYAVNFEEFVSEPKRFTAEMFNYLGLAQNDGAADYFSKIDLHGRMGDPTGIEQYKKISSESLGKWKYVFNNPLRKHWARNYLASINDETFSVMGYRRDKLLSELQQVPFSIANIGSDVSRMLYAKKYLRRQKKKWNY